jgi:hypothetical protein
VRAFLAIGDDKGIATFYARSHNRIQFKITQHFGFHFVQIPQNGLDIDLCEILRQFPNAVIEGLVLLPV